MKSEATHRLNQIIDFTLLGIIIVISVILIFTNDKPSPQLLALKMNFLEFTGEVQSQITNVDNYLELKEANDSLRMELEQLYHNNIKYKNAYFELLELKKNLNFKDDPTLDFIYAEVVAKTSTSVVKHMKINRGLKDGLKPNDPVVYKSLLIGKIISISDQFSMIQLAVDPLFEISVRVQRLGEVGTLSPTHSGSFKLKSITKNIEVMRGDVIVTSGLSTTYPKDIKIGVVKKVSNQKHGLFLEIDVEPLVNYNTLRYVSVIKRSQANVIDSILYNPAFEPAKVLNE